MSFAPLSVQNSYPLISAEDPALDLPSDVDAKETALRVARETGKWEALLRPDQKPTTFWMRNLPGTDRSWILGYQVRQRLVEIELCELAVRLALESIENFGVFGPIKRVSLEGRTLASTDVLDAIYRVSEDKSVGQRIVLELGGIVIKRLTEGIGPKS
jgi:hypothetical protein